MKIKGPLHIKGGTDELMDLIIKHVGKPKLPFTATGMTVTKNAHLLPDEFKKNVKDNGKGKGKKEREVTVTIQPKVESKSKKPRTAKNKTDKRDKNLLKQIISSIEEATDIDIDGDGVVGNQEENTKQNDGDSK